MACRFCQKPCGEREFCDEVCYDEYNEAMEEYSRWSAACPMIDDDDGPQNEWCGSRGNNI